MLLCEHRHNDPLHLGFHPGLNAHCRTLALGQGDLPTKRHDFLSEFRLCSLAVLGLLRQIGQLGEERFDLLRWWRRRESDPRSCFGMARDNIADVNTRGLVTDRGTEGIEVA